MDNNTEVEPSTFISDVCKGLRSIPKRISSKYFYDDKGSRIFQEIMNMPEYYLTNAEHSILATQSDKIADNLQFGNEFSIIELGAGDGKKTLELLKYLLDQKYVIHYRPVDISEEAIRLLESDLNEKLPSLNIQPLIGDYFHVLGALPSRKKAALFLFLGSNIGNYEMSEAINLLQQFNEYLQKGDKILIGFDLMKNPRTILQAYDDPGGITRRFNLNLLDRMNRELGMNFDKSQFEFYPHYNPNNGELRSTIVSLADQTVHSDLLGESFTFRSNELLHTELSKKYSFFEIETLAQKTGFHVQNHFIDEHKLFADSLWIKN